MSGELVEDVVYGSPEAVGWGISVVFAGILVHYDYCDGDQDEGDADQ